MKREIIIIEATKDWGKGKWELLFNRYRVYIWDNMKVLEIDSGDGYKKKKKKDTSRGREGHSRHRKRSMQRHGGMNSLMFEKSSEAALLVVLGRKAGV